MQDSNTRVPSLVAGEYFVGDAIDKIAVACQPVNRHIVHICKMQTEVQFSTSKSIESIASSMDEEKNEQNEQQIMSNCSHNATGFYLSCRITF